MLSIKNAVQGFAAVGSEARLSVLLSLVKAGDNGLTVGEVNSKFRHQHWLIICDISPMRI